MRWFKPVTYSIYTTSGALFMAGLPLANAERIMARHEGEGWRIEQD